MALINSPDFRIIIIIIIIKVPDFCIMFMQVAQFIKGFINIIPFISGLLPNLAKSSCG
jgi:hypothetical protein